ncbi:hypothetical protein RJ639_021696 [Escallonia herrerae]|uniref:NADP-dependent oxidoreductase domain-containing protein n=1 Tax=Escallonia herrerae TaxID=1293975 RepID=A0AA89AG64_9ASTE|nr:hypothetical protein RJ639_021696 [Escallonia herrerae]
MAMIPQITVGSSGKPMPIIGMGTYPYPPLDLETAKSAILEAIKVGYRHFDTAFAYHTEEHLAAAIPEALRLGLINSRDELFITTKLSGIFGFLIHVRSEVACRREGFGEIRLAGEEVVFGGRHGGWERQAAHSSAHRRRIAWLGGGRESWSQRGD